MKVWSPVAAVAMLLVLAGAGPWVTGASAQASQPPQPVDLVLGTSHTFRIALDQRASVKSVGQPVTGTLVDAMYAYDRLVIPAGARVIGHVSAIEALSRMARVQAGAGGDFAPPRTVTLQFDRLFRSDGTEVAIHTVVVGYAKRLSVQVARAPAEEDDEEQSGVVARAKQEGAHRIQDAKQAASEKMREALQAIKSPDRMEMLKTTAMEHLPYHPQYLTKGSVYTVALEEPVSFGAAVPAERAPADAAVPPGTFVTAKLLNALDSRQTPRGTTVAAVVTEPIFSASHQLLVPEGARLIGEVTFAAGARSFHRDGRLRFLFESIETDDRAPAPFMASLSAVQVSDEAPVEVDDEGGAQATESKTRFIAPALAVAALASMVGNETRRIDNDADDTLPGPKSGGPVSRGVGGFLGLSVVGLTAAQFSHPVAIGLTVWGLARTLYGNILSRGREVTFPAGTEIQVRLAPGPEAAAAAAP